MNYQPIDIEVSKASINGKVYDVLSYDEYVKNLDAYRDRTDIAVKQNVYGEEVILPYNGPMKIDPITPGIYDGGIVDFIKKPEKEDIEKYIPEKIVTFSNKSDIANIIANGNMVKYLDEPFITSPDNITITSITEKDQPEMRCLKAAINEKHIDLDKYAGRFSDNYPNDKRQLKGSSVTLNIIKRFCENCDMEAVLTIRDKSPDVPNPIGKDISISLTNFDPADLINIKLSDTSDDESED